MKVLVGGALSTGCLVEASDWMKGLARAVETTASTMLEGGKLKPLALTKELPPEFSGAFLQIVASHDPVLVGIIGPDSTCYALSRTLLGMDTGEELTVGDMNDAMGEIINVAAGGLKTNLENSHGNIQLGLPLFLNGRLSTGGNIGVEVVTSQLAGHFCALIVLSLSGRKN